MDDTEKQQAFNRLLKGLEPYLREALHSFLWNEDHTLQPGPEYAPNVRLIWVARRTLFGAREPAITLIRTADGQTLDPAMTLTVQEVR